jgi:hypothetical protein
MLSFPEASVPREMLSLAEARAIVQKRKKLAGDSGLRDWSAHRRSLLGKCGSEFEAIMQRCLSMHESRIVLLEKEPTAVEAHMCMNTARMMLLSDMGDAAEALETVLLRNRDDADSAGEVACFLSTIRRSQENACREYGVETVGTVATAATVGGHASIDASGPPAAWSSTLALGRDPGRSVIYDGFRTPIGGGLAAAAQAARGDGTRCGTAPPARQCARRFFGQPFGAGEAEPRFGENGWRDGDGGDGDGGGGGVGEDEGGRPAARGGSTAWAPKKKKRIEKKETTKEREVGVSGESNTVLPRDTSTDDGVRGGAGGRVARPLSPGYVLLYHTRTNT